MVMDMRKAQQCILNEDVWSRKRSDIRFRSKATTQLHMCFIKLRMCRMLQKVNKNETSSLNEHSTRTSIFKNS